MGLTAPSRNIKGVLLCGGKGLRLRPFTRVINKHLIRVHTFPMAEFPLRQMVQSGVKDIMIVTGGENFAAVVKYFGSGVSWGVNINYAIQDSAGGIAHALYLTKSFVGTDKVLVCLGDNVWSMSIQQHVHDFLFQPAQSAKLFCIKSDNPETMGVLKLRNGEVIDVVEKPKTPPSNEVLTGIYMYDYDVFSVIENIERSERNELEITDVNRHYILKRRANIVTMTGWWSDCGTMESILKTEELIKNDRSFQAVYPF